MTKSTKTLKAIDLFSGAGGFSTGASQAGAKVILAANHWELAVQIHQENHPQAAHVCQDINLINWAAIPDHDLLLASPCCQGHSKARGGKDAAHSSESRQTAWSVVDALTVKRPRFFVVENVPEFSRWEDFDLWKIAIERKGYRMTMNVLNAAEFGVAQNRERLFIVGAQDQEITIRSPKLAPVSAESILDWNNPSFAPIAAKARAEIVTRQVENGRRIHGDRFLIVYNGTEKNGRSIAKPLPTVTCSDRIAVVNGEMIRFLRPSEIRKAMGFPEGYVLPKTHRESVKMLGNAVVPAVAREIVRQIQLVA